MTDTKIVFDHEKKHELTYEDARKKAEEIARFYDNRDLKLELHILRMTQLEYYRLKGLEESIELWKEFLRTLEQQNWLSGAALKNPKYKSFFGSDFFEFLVQISDFLMHDGLVCLSIGVVIEKSEKGELIDENGFNEFGDNCLEIGKTCGGSGGGSESAPTPEPVKEEPADAWKPAEFGM